SMSMPKHTLMTLMPRPYPEDSRVPAKHRPYLVEPDPKRGNDRAGATQRSAMDFQARPGTTQPAGESPPRTPWTTIALIYVGGVVTAMSLGKYSPVGPQVADQLGL